MNYNKLSQKPRHQKEYREPRDQPTAKTQNEYRMATVISSSKLNIREEPNLKSEIVTTVDPGDQVEVRESKGEWAYVYVDNALQGYAMCKYIKVNKE